MKELRLAACCVILVAAGATNKDQPRRGAEPRKQATGCEYLGAGYIKVPGSDTCIKVGGSVSVEGAARTNR